MGLAFEMDEDVLDDRLGLIMRTERSVDSMTSS